MQNRKSAGIIQPPKTPELPVQYYDNNNSSFFFTNPTFLSLKDLESALRAKLTSSQLPDKPSKTA